MVFKARQTDTLCGHHPRLVGGRGRHSAFHRRLLHQFGGPLSRMSAGPHSAMYTHFSLLRQLLHLKADVAERLRNSRKGTGLSEVAAKGAQPSATPKAAFFPSAVLGASRPPGTDILYLLFVYFFIPVPRNIKPKLSEPFIPAYLLKSWKDTT